MKKAITIGIVASRFLLLLAIISLLILPGCGNSGNTNGLFGLLANTDKSGSSFITASAGGTVQLNDEVTLSIPADSLSEDTEITIERVKTIPGGEADGLSAFGQAYRFLPKGTGFDLSSPAILEMNYDTTALALKGLSSETMQICYFDEVLSCYVPVNCWIDAARNKIIAQVEHFTVYLPMAKALLPTNNEPYVGLQAPVPNPIRAGAPIYIRATVTDFDGAIAGVALKYRKLQPVSGGGVWHTVRMLKESNHQTTLHTYGYLIPASFLTAADIGPGNDIEYRIEATDNLGSVRTSAVRRYDVTLTYQAGSLSISPATLEITAGFQRALLSRGVDSNNAAFTLIPETFSMTDGTCDLQNRFAQGILLSAVTATPSEAPDQLEVGFGSESAAASVTVHPGEIESLEILDTNGLSISGDLSVSEGTVYEFDVVGHDGYGNSIPVITTWSADAAIGSIDTDGILDTTGAHGPGVVSASLMYATDTQNVVVQSRAKEITAFSINGVDGVIAYPFITVTLPWGTDLTGLVANFTTTGQTVTSNAAVQQSGVSANDFTDPVVYTVTAEDGSSQDYTVQVRMLSPYKEITAYSINGSSGNITGNTITVNLTSGTDVTALVAEFTTTGQSVAVGGFVQQSGLTANDFTNSVTYIVTAEDGSTFDYTVSILLGLQGVVTHFAGSIGGAGSTDGIGQEARFNRPADVTSDGANIYVADTQNHTIRKINISTHEVTTFAGMSGIMGSTNGIGSVARFRGPNGITCDGINLYVADTYNNVIRKIVISTGEVTTIAGLSQNPGSADGIGSSARFYIPSGIATDGINLYVADSLNHTIRKIVIDTREVTTIAGLAGSSGSVDGISNSARFIYPRGITIIADNLYITESCTIRNLSITTGQVTTIAGLANSGGAINGIGSAARFSNPYGITNDGANLYIADQGNRAIRKVLIANAEVTTFAGTMTAYGSIDGTGNAARFSNPLGISRYGNKLFVADTYNDSVRTIDIPSADVTTTAGMPASFGSTDGIGSNASFGSPAGITNDSNNLYIADSSNHIIRKIVISSGEVITLAGMAGVSGSSNGIGTMARFHTPYGITTDGINLFVTDWFNCIIRKIVIATGEVTTLAGLAGNTGSIDGSGNASRFNYPKGITTDGANLYVVDTNNHTIRKIVISTGVVSTLAGMAGNTGTADGIGIIARFNYPQGIIYTGGNLYVNDTNNFTIRKIVISTGEVSTIAGLAGTGGTADGTGSSARFSSHNGIATDGFNLYIIEPSAYRIRKLIISTVEVTTLAGDWAHYGSIDGIGTQARFYMPSSATFAGGNLYVSDTGNNCIRKIE